MRVIDGGASVAIQHLLIAFFSWTKIGQHSPLLLKKRALDCCYSKEVVIKLSLQFTQQGRQQNTIENER